MADQFDVEGIDPPELTRERIHEVDDERFRPETVAIVTGAASGIGQATAVALAANGLTVVAADIDAEGLDRTLDIAEDLDTERVVPVETDLTVDADIHRIVEVATDAGDVSFLANIAGIQHIAPIEEVPMEVYDRMHRVMLRAPFYLTKLVLPHIRESGSGCVGNMASVMGHVAARDKAPYVAAKFGIRGLTQAIAAESDGSVRSFSVSPTTTKTPLVMNQLPDIAERRDMTIEEVVEEVRLGPARVKEMMDPVDIANVFTIGFSHLGSHLVGGDLLWDGGKTLTFG